MGLVKRTKGQLVAAYGSGSLTFVLDEVQDKNKPRSKLTSMKPLESFSEEDQKQALRKYQYIQCVIQKYGNKVSYKNITLIEDLLAERIDDPNPPSASSIYRWWKTWQMSGEDIVALIPRKGGRSSRHLSQYKELLYEVVEEVLFRPEPGTMQDAYELFQARINEKKPYCHGAISLPSRATFYRLAKKLIDPYELVKAQQGKRVADKRYRVSGSGVKTTRILERVEIDHTPIDLMVIDEATGEAIGRPNLTLIIDHYSRMPLGFYLGFEPPSSVSVMRAIRHAVLPKSYLVDKYLDFQNEWPAYGIFWVLVCDNGSEFHDHQLKRLALELNIELFFCPKSQPYYKGVVERFLGSLNRAVCHSLVGTTRSNIQQRGGYDSVEHASVTLEKLRYYVHDWIINVYNLQYHEGLGDSPFNVWTRGLQHVEPPLPLCRERLDLILTKEHERQVNHEGVSHFRLKYNSYELGILRRKLPQGAKVKVRIDPENLGVVWVLDEHEGEFFSVPCTDPEYAEGLSMRQHKHILAMRADRRRKLETEELLNNKVRFKNEIRDAAKSKGLRKRTKAAQLSQLPIVESRAIPLPAKKAQSSNLNFDELEEFDVDWGDKM